MVLNSCAVEEPDGGPAEALPCEVRWIPRCVISLSFIVHKPEQSGLRNHEIVELTRFRQLGVSHGPWIRARNTAFSYLGRAELSTCEHSKTRDCLSPLGSTTSCNTATIPLAGEGPGREERWREPPGQRMPLASTPAPVVGVQELF